MTQIVTITSPLRVGETATLFARTSPGATCDIIFYTPLGNRSMTQGLARKPADSAGNVSWSWMIGTNTTPGIGSVTVTCAGQSAFGRIQIV